LADLLVRCLVVAHVPKSLVPVSDGDLVLRAASEAELLDLVAVFGDPLIVRWNPAPSYDDVEAAARTWINQRNDWSNGEHASWVLGGTDGALLGSVSLHHIDIDHENAEVGYWIAPAVRGRGLAARGVEMAARFAFTTLGFRRLYLYHSVENPASCRVAERAGFALEGTTRESYRYPDGRFHDEHLHGRLATDQPS
jgi:RimJ/RimL family protein N-acetyltransferase